MGSGDAAVLSGFSILAMPASRRTRRSLQDEVVELKAMASLSALADRVIIWFATLGGGSGRTSLTGMSMLSMPPPKRMIRKMPMLRPSSLRRINVLAARGVWRSLALLKVAKSLSSYMSQSGGNSAMLAASKEKNKFL